MTSPHEEPRICVLIPVYNHSETLMEVVRQAKDHFPVIVVDDGSTDGAKELLEREPGVTSVVLPENRGKGAALQAGFTKAQEQGFTHAITMDADGQHAAGDLPAFAEACRRDPNALVVGIRDLKGAGAPFARRFANGFSNFWVWVETGKYLRDTQTGFRCYPLAPVCRIKVTSSRYAHELELLVRAVWAGVSLAPIPVKVDYGPATSGRSHFRPSRDFLAISWLNTRLVTQAIVLPLPVRVLWARKEVQDRPFMKRAWTVVRLFFTDNSDSPWRVSCAVGMGLFFGIVPIWGFQMMAVALVAHALRLNKAIALAASNISIPVMIPFIILGSLFLGHLVMTGEIPHYSWEDLHALDADRAVKSLGEYVLGSFVLAVLVGGIGGGAAFCLAALISKPARARE